MKSVLKRIASRNGRADQRGFSLAELALSVGIGSVVSIGAASLLAWTAQNKTEAMQIAQLKGVKETILRTLTNNNGFMTTMSLNGNMNCLVAGTVCPANVPQPFTLYSGTVAQATPIADSANPNSGFTTQGTACNTFSLAGNDACPFRYDLRWSAVCNGGGAPPCVNPQILINAKLLYRPNPASNNKLQINPDRYSIEDVYINNGANSSGTQCYSNTQQVYITNPTPGVPLVTNFVVPPYNSGLYVELWGGGGGGGGQNSIVPNPGFPGSATTFGALSAPGGLGGGNLWAWGSMICCWTVPFCAGVGSAQINGWNAQASNPFFLGGIAPNQCSPVNASNAGGAGGAGTFALWGFQGYNFGGGGGGAGWLWGDAMTGCPIAVFAGVGGGDGLAGSSGGKYANAVFTPAMLPPGTVVPLTVGAGGVGGIVGTCIWMGGPLCMFGQAGAGASGVAKITWQ